MRAGVQDQQAEKADRRTQRTRQQPDVKTPRRSLSTIPKSMCISFKCLPLTHFIEEDDDEVVADAEVRLVELVGHVEPEALKLAPL